MQSDLSDKNPQEDQLRRERESFVSSRELERNNEVKS